MLEANQQEILARLDDRALVLDVGGGLNPFPRADWVIDLLPWAKREHYGEPVDVGRERFSKRTWLARDICDREPWPFPEDHFDFVVCSHTLEDIRDPIWVCAEITRVGKAGYIEVPSRFEEQSYGFQGGWVGWGHHRWLIDIDGDEVEFVFKHQIMHARRDWHFDRDFRRSLPPDKRVRWLCWQETFRFRERVLLSAEEVDRYLEDFVRAHAPARPSLLRRTLRAARRVLTRSSG